MASSPSNARQPQVYQIDFTAVASGKRIASTKRRVRWRFGFANPEALANGQTGTACRGEEHDVTIVWSITSGKRVILADGKEVHYSSNRNNVFEFSWTMKGNHVLKILAHASPPLSVTPGFRQYDFFVDGQSFFSFPKVFRLGLAPNDPRGARSPRSPPGVAERGSNYRGAGAAASVRSNGSANLANIEAPKNPDEEEAYLREAIKNSLADGGGRSGASVMSAPPSSSAGNDLLLDFAAPAPAPAAFGAPAPAAGGYYPEYPAAPAPAQGFAALPPSTTAPQANGYGNTGAADPWGAASAAGSYTTAPPPTGYAPAPAAAYQAPAPAPYGAAPSDPFAPANDFAAPPQQQPAYGMQQAPEASPYGSPRPAMVPAGANPFTPGTQASSIGFQSPVASMGSGPEPVPAPQPAPAESNNPALQSMDVLSGQAPSLVTNDMKAGADGSVADQAYAKLMNMGTFDLVKGNNEQERANPFDMAATSNGIDNQTSLADMKAQSSTQGQKQPVMNSAPVANGAMVLSNNQQGNFGGYSNGLGQQPTAGYGQPPMQQQYGMQQQPPMQQPQQYGQAPPMQQPQYGQAPPMQQQYGQPPPVQQQYGQQPW